MVEIVNESNACVMYVQDDDCVNYCSIISCTTGTRAADDEKEIHHQQQQQQQHSSAPSSAALHERTVLSACYPKETEVMVEGYVAEEGETEEEEGEEEAYYELLELMQLDIGEFMSPYDKIFSTTSLDDDDDDDGHDDSVKNEGELNEMDVVTTQVQAQTPTHTHPSCVSFCDSLEGTANANDGYSLTLKTSGLQDYQKDTSINSISVLTSESASISTASPWQQQVQYPTTAVTTTTSYRYVSNGDGDISNKNNKNNNVIDLCGSQDDDDDDDDDDDKDCGHQSRHHHNDNDNDQNIRHGHDDDDTEEYDDRFVNCILNNVKETLIARRKQASRHQQQQQQTAYTGGKATSIAASTASASACATFLPDTTYTIRELFQSKKIQEHYRQRLVSHTNTFIIDTSSNQQRNLLHDKNSEQHSSVVDIAKDTINYSRTRKVQRHSQNQDNVRTISPSTVCTTDSKSTVSTADHASSATGPSSSPHTAATSCTTSSTLRSETMNEYYRWKLANRREKFLQQVRKKRELSQRDSSLQQQQQNQVETSSIHQQQIDYSMARKLQRLLEQRQKSYSYTTTHGPSLLGKGTENNTTTSTDTNSPLQSNTTQMSNRHEQTSQNETFVLDCEKKQGQTLNHNDDMSQHNVDGANRRPIQDYTNSLTLQRFLKQRVTKLYPPTNSTSVAATNTKKSETFPQRSSCSHNQLAYCQKEIIVIDDDDDDEEE